MVTIPLHGVAPVSEILPTSRCEPVERTPKRRAQSGNVVISGVPRIRNKIAVGVIVTVLLCATVWYFNSRDDESLAFGGASKQRSSDSASEIRSEAEPARAVDVPVTTAPRTPMQRESESSCADALSRRQLRNGRTLSSNLDSSGGYGALTVDNGTAEDAVIELVDTSANEITRSFYVSAGHKFTSENISPGSYLLLFTTGLDWDSDTYQFTCNAQYFQFGKTLAYAEEEQGDAIRYSRKMVTLHRVLNGNAEKRSIDRAAFLRKRHAATLAPGY